MRSRGARAGAQRAEQHHVPVGHAVPTSRRSEGARRAASQSEDLHVLASSCLYQSGFITLFDYVTFDLLPDVY